MELPTTSDPANRRNSSALKRSLGNLGLGILVLLIVFSFVAFVSNDARYALLLGVGALLGAGIWRGQVSFYNWLTAVLLSGPLIIAFKVAALPQLPGLWPHLVFWALFALTGCYLLHASRSERRIAVAGALLLCVSCGWYVKSYISREVSRSLTRVRNDAAPSFVFTPLSEGAATTATEGKVLVIDFFGTWCAPCIAELPELTEVRKELGEQGNIDFVLVSNDSGGDTPERVKSFAARRKIDFPVAYDTGGKAYAAFGFSGVPALVVIDRTGRIRLKREGFNSADTNFRRDLVEFVKTL
jgi:thiol-disulfide isomerase/thioredoxin